MSLLVEIRKNLMARQTICEIRKNLMARKKLLRIWAKTHNRKHFLPLKYVDFKKAFDSVYRPTI